MRAYSRYPAAWLAVTLSVAACGVETGGEAEPSRARAGTDSDSSAARLLARSIAFHDPGGLWGHRALRLRWIGTGGDGADRVALDIEIDPVSDRFSMRGRYRGSEIEYEVANGAWTASVDGRATPTREDRERMRLDREDGFFWRSYFEFLVGVPMKFADPGAHLDPEVFETEFLGQEVAALRVRYDPDVGGDTWYAYLDPATAKLVGLRFYHDEAAGDGEYLVLEELVEAGGLRVPRVRRWYVNADDAFLGADEIESFEVY